MGHPIFTTEKIGDFLRDTGYKSIDSALAEIVDNSLEAKCDDCFIIVKESRVQRSVRMMTYVSDIVILDNGKGMDDETLSGCLSVGYTTRYERTGMGRFGVGLPQASLYASPAVDVYSWQGGVENCRKVFLDARMVKDSEQIEIDDPCPAEIPEEYRKFLVYRTENGRSVSFREHGTLVHWKACDRVQPSTANSLLKRLDFALGQKYRHLISDGKKHIRVIKLGDEELSYDIVPNDPLMLMLPNYVMGNPEKDPMKIAPKKACLDAIFEPYANEHYPDGVISVPVQYVDQKTDAIKSSQVKVRFSIVKLDYYLPEKFDGRNPGSTWLGDHLKKLEGISVVRAGREIDFGTFDFYENINEPQHRWWGCEISFEPELDEVFGVSNNKQYVDLKRGKEPIYEGIRPIWDTLAEEIGPVIKSMYARNRDVQAHSRGKRTTPTPPSVSIINTVEKGEEGDTGAPQPDPAPEEIEQGKAFLAGMDIEPTDQNAKEFLGNYVNFIYRNAGWSPFIDFSYPAKTIVITINTDHLFYKTFCTEIQEVESERTAFELFIASLAVSVKRTNVAQKEANDALMQTWDAKLVEYIREQAQPMGQKKPAE